MSASFALLIVSFLVVLLLSRRMYLYAYTQDDGAISVKIFSVFTIFRIRYDNILDARACPWWEVWSTGFIPLVLKNRFATRFVAVRLKSGFFRFVILTPTSPDNFAKSVTERVLALR